ncbi:hypothetical protein [Syntrophus aciditrophicus]|nr:hypothetical protein [Syntrophus aciditrophicus]
MSSTWPFIATFVLCLIFGFLDGFHWRLLFVSIILTLVGMAGYRIIDRAGGQKFWNNDTIILWCSYAFILAFMALSICILFMLSLFFREFNAFYFLGCIWITASFIGSFFINDEFEDWLRTRLEERKTKPVSEMEFKRIFNELVVDLKIGTHNDAELLQKSSLIYERILHEDLGRMGLLENYLQTDRTMQLYFLNKNIPDFREYLRRMIKTIKREII